MKRYLIICIGLILFTLLSVQAQNDLPDPMSPPRMVNDFAGVFTASQTADLETMLRTYHDTTTTQIYVITVNTLNGDAPSNYAARLGEKWGIGQKGKDNGVLILIKPKIGNERGQVFIATGYGVEARLTDAITGRIIDENMIPYLRENNDYYTATKKAIYAIIERLSGEYSVTDGQQNKPQSFIDNLLDNIIGFFTCCCIFPLFIFLMIYSKTFRNLVFFFLLLGGGRGGGGGRSGGFGGGGGGRFGGGGAGRSW